MSEKKCLRFVKAVDEVAQCAVCLGRVTPPLTACDNGHAFCKSCTSTLTKCPTCQQGFLLNRPKMLEQLVAIQPTKCKYRRRGCEEVFKSDRHEEFCPCRPIDCCMGEVDPCPWTGNAGSWVSHLDTHHSKQKRALSLGLNDKVFHIPTETCCKKYFFVYRDLVFVILLKKNQSNELLITLRLIQICGYTLDCDWFLMEIEFVCHNGRENLSVPIAVNCKENVPLDDSPFDCRVPIPWVDAENSNTCKMYFSFEWDDDDDDDECDDDDDDECDEGNDDEYEEEVDED